MATDRVGRRALVLLAGLLTASQLYAQSPYQPNTTESAPVAVPTRNAKVPTYTFRRAETVGAAGAPGTPVRIVVNSPSEPAQPMMAIPQPTVPATSFQPVGEQPVMAAPAPVMVVPQTRILVPVMFQPQTAPDMLTMQPPAPPPQSSTPPGTPPSDADGADISLRDIGIEVDPPKFERLYRFESEAELKARIREEIKHRPKRMETGNVVFPPYEPLSLENYEPRTFAGVIKQIEPNYVIFGRLYGEDVNTERYGWSLGAIQPIWSAVEAYRDIALVPYRFAERPCQRFETSAGRCYPGDPVPYLLYPPEVSVTGAAWETVVIIGAAAIIP
ncbi:MAG: hypothetical protein ACJ8C4_02910 [Gemmataceae bacterium]